MNGTRTERTFLGTVLGMVLLGPAAAAAQAPAQASMPAKGAETAVALAAGGQLEDVLGRAGFQLQTGSIEYLDTVKEACLKRLPDALGNNPWPNAYLSLALPNPLGSSYELPNPWSWQLREDEAVLIVGKTPPPAAYFSYQTWVAALPGDYAYDPVTKAKTLATRRSIAVGDATNIATVRTKGRDPADRKIVYVVTANRTTEARLRTALRTAGIADESINVETISPVIAPLGIGPAGSIFFWAQRVAVPDDEDALTSYIKSPPYTVYRVTPTSPLATDPEPLPVLRTRGTGYTEMGLWPAVKRLRQAILEKEGAASPKLTATELVPRIWQTKLPGTGQLELLEKPFAGLQVGSFLWAATRDTNYFQSPYFMLRSAVDEYVIVFGVNHQKSGKATYSSVSVYLEPNQETGPGREFGLGTVLDRTFGQSARYYLPDDPQADSLYVLKLARSCRGTGPACLEIKAPPQVDMNGIHYDCDPPIDLETKLMYYVVRGYMEPATKVGPDDNELVWDRGIYFSASPKQQ